LRSRFLVLGLLGALTGCGGFVHDEQLAGSYRLVAIDDDSSMIVCRRVSGASCVGDELPGPTVFAAGANDKYITIARHPLRDFHEDKAVTEYYYVVRPPESAFLKATDVVGPLTEAQFNADKDRLDLPQFSKNIDNLR
jgi:hypothetical protein